MSEEVTQPVVEKPDTQPAAVAEGDGARKTDDFEAALQEFEATTQKPSSTPEPTTTAVPPDVVKRLEMLERKDAEETFKRYISPVIQKVRGDVPADIFDDDELIAWMDTKAKKDTRLQQAWINRDKNPQAWGKVVEGLSRDFAKKFSKPIDQQVTDDVAAVAAAVRGSPTKAPEDKPPNLGALGNKQAADEIEKRYGYRPNF